MIAFDGRFIAAFGAFDALPYSSRSPLLSVA
jgi:hypothetical protein